MLRLPRSFAPPSGTTTARGSCRQQQDKLLCSRMTTRFLNCRVVRDGSLVSDANSEVWVEHGRVVDQQARFWSSDSAREYDAETVVDCGGGILAPAFIDIHINGAFGVDFSSIKSSTDLQSVGRLLLQHGVASFCPTMVSSSSQRYTEVLPLLCPYDGSVERGATNLGVHLEGPFIHSEKRGAHKEVLLRSPTQGLQSLLDVYGERLEGVRYITLAPELDGAMDAIEALVKERGIRVSLGHSLASTEQCKQALGCGASCITHMFNAMSAFHHRNPGLVGALGIDAAPFYVSSCPCLVADGVHTHASAVEIAWRSHPEGAILVTDAMSGLGLEGQHQLGETLVDVYDGRAVVAGSKKLAGSAASMDSVVRYFRSATRCSIVQAVEAASLHPAKFLGIEERKGSIRVGADADFVLLTDSLEVIATFIAGRKAWHRDS